VLHINPNNELCILSTCTSLTKLFLFNLSLYVLIGQYLVMFVIHTGIVVSFCDGFFLFFFSFFCIYHCSVNEDFHYVTEVARDLLF